MKNTQLSGYILIETLIASFIISVGIISSMHLLGHNLKQTVLQTIAIDKFIQQSNQYELQQVPGAK